MKVERTCTKIIFSLGYWLYSLHYVVLIGVSIYSLGWHQNPECDKVKSWEIGTILFSFINCLILVISSKKRMVLSVLLGLVPFIWGVFVLHLENKDGHRGHNYCGNAKDNFSWWVLNTMIYTWMGFFSLLVIVLILTIFVIALDKTRLCENCWYKEEMDDHPYTSNV